MATQLSSHHARLVECSEEEWQARLHLAACYRIFNLLGLGERLLENDRTARSWRD